MSEEVFKEGKCFTQHDVENKQLKENENENENENEKLRNENENQNENEQLRKNNIVKDVQIKESIEKPKEVKNPNCFDKNKFKNILAIIDSSKFNYRHKIGKFKYTDIKDLVNNIRNNTISERSAKKSLNTLNEIKNTEIIKNKKHTPGQKQLLNLFNDLLDTILSGKTLKSESQEDKNENENDNDKTLMSSKDQNEIESDKTLMLSNEDNENENENEDDDETISQIKMKKKRFFR